MHAHTPAVAGKIAKSIAAYRPELLARARGLVGASDADDLTQSTLERALRHIDHFRPETNLLSWLRTIMFNLTVDGWRREKCLRTSAKDPDEVLVPVEEPPPWADLTGFDIRAAARRLSPGFRLVFELHCLWGLSYGDIARQLHVAPGTVGSRLMRARQQLRSVLTALLDARQDLGSGEAQGQALEPPVPHGRRPHLPACTSPSADADSASPLAAVA
jgi:RNA polymerase sigma-70 factor (ECF subfamily)